MFPPHPTELLHLLLGGEISAGDFVIDATAGNGHDTCFLAKCVGAEGKVLAIDIQPQAIASTRARLESEGLSERVTLHLGSHVDIAEACGGECPHLIAFNLGYLPGGDRAIVTRTEETLAAIGSAADLLRPGGMLAVVCYTGHDGAGDEAEAVVGFFTSLEGHRVGRYGMIATPSASPFLLISRKIR